MKMDKRKKKELTRMGNGMDYGLGGIQMDRRKQKELTRMGKKMENGLIPKQ